MAVRNFYVRGNIDGRQTDIGGGPTGKTGGLVLHLTQRENGEIVEALQIVCKASYGGSLMTMLYDSHGNEIYRFTTRR